MEKVSFTRNVNLQSEDGFIMGEHSKIPFEKIAVLVVFIFSMAWQKNTDTASKNPKEIITKLQRKRKVK